jgi:uncharacterized protein (TIGR02453 family)
MPAQPYFSRDLFQFLVELKFNNERPWFKARQERYEKSVKLPLQRFMADAAPKVAAVDPALSRPAVFRIHRDTRFAKDKTPYKTHAAAQFRHRAQGDDVHAPGIYLHLEPGDCFLAGGIWQPDAGALLAIRKRIARKDPAWLALKASRLPLYTDDKLKRPPKGFAAEHPLAEDLKLRSFMTWVDLSDAQACEPGFMARFVKACKAVDPMVRFLCGAMGLKG